MFHCSHLFARPREVSFSSANAMMCCIFKCIVTVVETKSWGFHRYSSREYPKLRRNQECAKSKAPIKSDNPYATKSNKSLKVKKTIPLYIPLLQIPAHAESRARAEQAQVVPSSHEKEHHASNYWRVSEVACCCIPFACIYHLKISQMTSWNKKCDVSLNN